VRQYDILERGTRPNQGYHFNSSVEARVEFAYQLISTFSTKNRYYTSKQANNLYNHRRRKDDDKRLLKSFHSPKQPCGKTNLADNCPAEKKLTKAEMKIRAHPTTEMIKKKIHNVFWCEANRNWA
jgi:hypothetical protein